MGSKGFIFKIEDNVKEGYLRMELLKLNCGSSLNFWKVQYWGLDH